MMNQQPNYTFLVWDKLRRAVASFLVPVLILAVSRLFSQCQLLLDQRDQRELQRVTGTKKRMVKDLKRVSCPSSISSLLGSAGAASPLMAVGALGTGGRLTPTSQLLARTSTAAVAAAAGAGKALFPLLDSLANNMIGDNPHLVEELRRTQCQMQELRDRNAALKAELLEMHKRYDLPLSDVLQAEVQGKLGSSCSLAQQALSRPCGDDVARQAGSEDQGLGCDEPRPLLLPCKADKQIVGASKPSWLHSSGGRCMLSPMR
ncbi:uncharacterized protein HaLaN_05286 [Haematococcus lacustris]|uniref:Uncharacterized protein n=1 Tax=Haematococcus lacustris TaxID=44745 RepID=A0A699YIW4_HAELA|nr:uncharacterized protein HaLaN_05286 [Haematococcus lacustris]